MFVKTFASLRLANIAVHHTLSNAQLMSKDIKQSSILYFSGEVSTKEVSSHSAFVDLKPYCYWLRKFGVIRWFTNLPTARRSSVFTKVDKL